MIWRAMLGYQRRLIEQAERAEHQAPHDPLTGLANCLPFERRLGARAGGRRRPAPNRRLVMLIDLNGFKYVNDTLGHQAGDDVLIETGQRLRQVCREGDTVSRIGGDEFAVLLPEVATFEAAKRSPSGRRGPAPQLTSCPGRLCCGEVARVGMVLGAGGSAQQMLRHADAAMYRAKATGRELPCTTRRSTPTSPTAWRSSMTCVRSSTKATRTAS